MRQIQLTMNVELSADIEIETLDFLRSELQDFLSNFNQGSVLRLEIVEFIPPLQQQIELQKKATGVVNAFDDHDDQTTKPYGDFEE